MLHLKFELLRQSFIADSLFRVSSGLDSRCKYRLVSKLRNKLIKEECVYSYV